MTLRLLCLRPNLIGPSFYNRCNFSHLKWSSLHVYFMKLDEVNFPSTSLILNPLCCNFLYRLYFKDFSWWNTDICSSWLLPIDITNLICVISHACVHVKSLPVTSVLKCRPFWMRWIPAPARWSCSAPLCGNRILVNPPGSIHIYCSLQLRLSPSSYYTQEQMQLR